MTLIEWQQRLAKTMFRWVRPVSSNGHPQPKAMILLVDDERELTQMVAYRLLANGYEVMAAASGEEALEKMAQRRPDAIILDVMLPGLDGNQVAECLRQDERTRAIPIIFLTGLAEPAEVERHNYQMGDRLMLAKPFTAEQLLGLLQRALTTK